MHVAGVFISRVGIFELFLWCVLAWKYLYKVSMLCLCSFALVGCRSTIPLSSIHIFHRVFPLRK